jgi:hypothetical protein
MNKTKNLLAAAVTGLFLGSTFGCTQEASSTAPEQKPAEQSAPTKGASAAALAVSEKHACKGLNSCAGKGGCSSGDNKCAAKNSCAGKGGCATVEHHGCAGKNSCKNQGGCKSSDQGCAGKNTCNAKGGCAVPVHH